MSDPSQPFPAPATPTSPCVRICVIDEPSGLCRGCLRTLEEIATWSTMAEETRRKVMATLSSRAGALS